MMIKYVSLALMLAAFAGFATPVEADRLKTMSGMNVEGKIISETEEHVIISTTYGELRFMKINLKQIERGAGGSAFAAGGGSAASATPSSDPFAQSSSDPFGSTAATAPSSEPFGSPGGATPANPFASSAAPAAGADSFGSAPAPAPPTEAANPFASSAAPAGDANPFGNAPAPAAPTDAANPFAPSAAPAGDANPFGNAPAPAAPTDETNPFSSTASPNPFGASAPPAPAADPFPPAGGAPNPFGGGPAANPFGASAPPRQVASAPPTASPEASARPVALSVPTARRAPDLSKKPEVSTGFDAVIYGLNKDFPIKIKQPTQADWLTVTEDQQLRVGSRVFTEETRTSRMLLRGKNDEIRLPNDSEVEVKHLSQDSEEVTLFLHRGSVWSEVSPRSRDDAFKVQTPELTAGVRGTRFVVERGGGVSKVTVHEGLVHVVANNTGAFVTVRPNQSAVVNSSGQILDLVATPVDHQKIWNEWEEWATSATAGGGSMAGAGPIGSLSQQIATDNAAWQATMEEGNRLIAQNRYMDKLQEYADAFEQFASDTGVIPEETDGWSFLRFDTGLPGWNGPYVEGAIPPADPWGRPLKYLKLRSLSGNVIGRVYSFGADGRDQGGENSSADMVSLIMYFRLDRFANDPDVAPQQ